MKWPFITAFLARNIDTLCRHFAAKTLQPEESWPRRIWMLLLCECVKKREIRKGERRKKEEEEAGV
jgi:hypothetical protein